MVMALRRYQGVSFLLFFVVEFKVVVRVKCTSQQLSNERYQMEHVDTICGCESDETHRSALETCRPSYIVLYAGRATQPDAQ